MWFLRDTRIQLFNKDGQKYKDLKKYWKSLTINTIKKPLSEKQNKKLKELLNLNAELRKTYYIVKEFHRIIDMKKPLSFERRLNGLIYRLSKLETKQSKKLKLTLQSWKQ